MDQVGAGRHHARHHQPGDDGLERVAETTGFGDSAEDSAVSGSPLSDYRVDGVEDDRLSGGLAGVIGVAIMAVLSTGLFWGLRRRGEPADSDPPDSRD